MNGINGEPVDIVVSSISTVQADYAKKGQTKLFTTVWSRLVVDEVGASHPRYRHTAIPPLIHSYSYMLLLRGAVIVWLRRHDRTSAHTHTSMPSHITFHVRRQYTQPFADG
jgi:hypothetical protein